MQPNQTIDPELPNHEREHKGVVIYEVHFEELNGTPAPKIDPGKPDRWKRSRFPFHLTLKLHMKARMTYK